MGLAAAKANGQQYGFRTSTLWARMKCRPEYNAEYIIVIECYSNTCVQLNEKRKEMLENLLYQIPEYRTDDLLQGCLMHHKKIHSERRLRNHKKKKENEQT